MTQHGTSKHANSLVEVIGCTPHLLLLLLLLAIVAIETSGTWNAMAVDLVQEIGRRITYVTEDSRETTFLFQRLSMALQQGNAVALRLPEHDGHRVKYRCSR